MKLLLTSGGIKNPSIHQINCFDEGQDRQLYPEEVLREILKVLKL